MGAKRVEKNLRKSLIGNFVNVRNRSNCTRNSEICAGAIFHSQNLRLPVWACVVGFEVLQASILQLFTCELWRFLYAISQTHHVACSCRHQIRSCWTFARILAWHFAKVSNSPRKLQLNRVRVSITSKKKLNQQCQMSAKKGKKRGRTRGKEIWLKFYHLIQSVVVLELKNKEKKEKSSNCHCRLLFNTPESRVHLSNLSSHFHLLIDTFFSRSTENIPVKHTIHCVLLLLRSFSCVLLCCLLRWSMER